MFGVVPSTRFTSVDRADGKFVGAGTSEERPLSNWLHASAAARWTLGSGFSRSVPNA